jgi:hypothetical protein
MRRSPRRRTRARATNHHETFVKPPPRPPPRHRAAAGSAAQTRAIGRWVQRKRRHRDVLNKEPGDRVIFERHDFNFYTKCGFLAIIYNPSRPALRYVAMLQEEFLEYEIAWRFEEAIPIRALADIEGYPALAKVTNDMSTRLMIAGQSGLVMFVPETTEVQDDVLGDWINPQQGQKTRDAARTTEQRKRFDPSAPLGNALKTAKFCRLYQGHRANTKEADLIFTVSWAELEGSIGRCLRFVVEIRPRDRQKVRKTALSGAANSKSENVRVQFYYSTTLLQHILVSIDALGQGWLKRELCRNLCKYMDVEERGVMSQGTPELQFSLKRLEKETVMIDGLPGASQAALTRRLSERGSEESRPVEQTHLLVGGAGGGGSGAATVGAGLGTITNRPAWRGTSLKTVTASEKQATPRGTSTLDLMYRKDERAITPDSVVLHRRLGMGRATRVEAVVGGNQGVLNRTNEGWRNKALLPAQRIASLPPVKADPHVRREAKFYAAAHERVRHHPKNYRYLDHTSASHASQWENRNRPRDDNDLLLSHDHAPNHGGGNLSLWNAPLVLSPRSPRIGEGRRKFGSTVRSPRLPPKRRGGKGGRWLRPTEIVTNSGDSVQAAKSIVRERAERDGVLGRNINVQWSVT